VSSFSEEVYNNSKHAIPLQLAVSEVKLLGGGS